MIKFQRVGLFIKTFVINLITLTYNAEAAPRNSGEIVLLSIGAL